jgi:hypothetical protein
MSKENAKQMLDAFMQDEKGTQDRVKQMQLKQRQQRKTSKEW